MRNHPSYRVSAPANAAMPAPTALHGDCVSRNRTVKYSNAASAVKKTASVMGIEARYSALGFSAYNAAATAPAAALAKTRRTAAYKNVTPIAKQIAGGRAPARPLVHSA